MNNKQDASIALANRIKAYLSLHNISHNLPQISYEILALQLLDSANNAAKLQRMTKDSINPECCNPNSALFNPLKAILVLRHSDYNEACWLSFLLIYTDDSERANWAFMRQLYAGVGLKTNRALTWTVVNKNQTPNMPLLHKLAQILAQSHPKSKFGQHRAYESLAHLPIVLSSYIAFINEQKGHRALLQPKHDNNISVAKTEHFNTLYSLIRHHVYRFGRLSTYEFLCLLGKTGLANIAPDSCYIAEASGPKRGAKLLFGMLDNTQLDSHAVGLANYLDMGYQEVEAALCHWQKSPNKYLQHN